MNNKLKAALVLLVMYGLGVFSGVAWNTYEHHRAPGFHSPFAERRLKKLKSDLKLSDQQEQQIREIFSKAHDRASQINEEVSWDLADIHKDSVAAIRQILTPEQQQKFEKIHQRFHARHHMPEDEPGPHSAAGTTEATS